jgi:hypothetical protein
MSKKVKVIIKGDYSEIGFLGCSVDELQDSQIIILPKSDENDSLGFREVTNDVKEYAKRKLEESDKAEFMRILNGK